MINQNYGGVGKCVFQGVGVVCRSVMFGFAKSVLRVQDPGWGWYG